MKHFSSTFIYQESDTECEPKHLQLLINGVVISKNNFVT